MELNLLVIVLQAFICFLHQSGPCLHASQTSGNGLSADVIAAILVTFKQRLHLVFLSLCGVHQYLSTASIACLSKYAHLLSPEEDDTNRFQGMNRCYAVSLHTSAPLCTGDSSSIITITALSVNIQMRSSSGNEDHVRPWLCHQEEEQGCATDHFQNRL